MNTVTPHTTIHDLVKAYPFLVEFLASYNPKYAMLSNKVMRVTMGRVASLEKVAAIGSVPIKDLLEAIRAEIERKTGQSVAIDLSGTPASTDDGERLDAIKGIIEDLHRGASLDEVKGRFDEALRDVSPDQIAAMEQRLIREGMPVSEVQRLCDLHVGVFKGSLDRHEEVQAPEGHPIHTYMSENTVITGLLDRLSGLMATLGDPPEASRLDGIQSELREVLGKLQGLDNHYVRKENQLFPFLEKHGISGPTQVMWGVHDQIRAHLKGALAALDEGEVDALSVHGTALAREAAEMVYKENKILFPLAMGTLTAEEWADVRRGEDVLGYALAVPAAKGFGETVTAREQESKGATGGLLTLSTGELPPVTLDALLKSLPVDVTFVDAEGYVRYYSDNPDRVFPRSPGIIGRHVEKCHPPKSIHRVKQILSAFESGEKDEAEFWIRLKERFVHILYVAVRDDEGTYLGTLEVTQDATHLRELEGERRLLDWNEGDDASH